MEKLKKVEVAVDVTLSKYTEIVTDKYKTVEETTSEKTDEGFKNVTSTSYEFDKQDLIEKYNEQEFSIPELLEKLKRYAENELQLTDNPKDIIYLNSIIESCNGWEYCELNVEPE